MSTTRWAHEKFLLILFCFWFHSIFIEEDEEDEGEDGEPGEGEDEDDDA